jgi:hypothetical protein
MHFLICLSQRQIDRVGKSGLKCTRLIVGVNIGCIAILRWKADGEFENGSVKIVYVKIDAWRLSW